MRDVVWVAWAGQGGGVVMLRAGNVEEIYFFSENKHHQIKKTTLGQSQWKTNQTDPIYAKKSLPGGS